MRKATRCTWCGRGFRAEGSGRGICARCFVRMTAPLYADEKTVDKTEIIIALCIVALLVAVLYG